MYHVIIVLDATRNRSYYHSYVEENGNIECEELPPYADVNKARACYWDANAKEWIFDTDKHAEIVAEQEAAKAAEEQARKEAAAIPTNKEIAKALAELANDLAELEEKLIKSEEGGEVDGSSSDLL